MPEESKKPSELYPKVAECESRLSDLIKQTINVGNDMLSANGGKMYIPDIFFIGILNRSINLIDAILCLTSRWNFIAAGPLVRLHLDTLLRLSYLRTTQNPDTFIMHILEGKQVNKMKDEKGVKLTDTRLCDYARTMFPQVDNVYKETSRFIHFSDKHVFSCITPDEFFIGKGFRKWPERDIVSLLDCTIEITEMILAITRGWIVQKVKMDNSADEQR